MKEINSELDKQTRFIAREDFCADTLRFTQYLDENDYAHILFFDETIKKQMLDEQRIDLNPWIEIFTIDPSYCRFKNKNNVVIGRVKLLNLQNDTWGFVLEKNSEEQLVITCQSKYPYDCEREVIQWMITSNKLQYFIELNEH